MGLAASQGRYLSLTARNNDLIYEAQQISQQRLNIAKDTQVAADKYNKALSNTIMQASTPEGSNQRLTYEILTSQDPFSGLCMRLIDSYGNVVVPKQGYTLEVTKPNEDGIDQTTKVTSSAEFLAKFMPDLDSDTAEKLKAMNLEELSEYYKTNFTDSNLKLNLRNNVNTNLINEGEHYLEDDNCLDPAYLQEMITSGEWTIQQAGDTESGWDDITWQGSNSITEIYDTSDDAVAEAEYETATKELQKEDKILELKLEQVQTEQKAVET